MNRNLGSPYDERSWLSTENSVRSRLGRVGWRTGSYYC